MRQDFPEPPLTTAVTAAVRSPVSHDDFDPTTALTTVLADIGMDLSETGGSVEFVGADPVVPSPLRLGAGAAIALAAKSAAVAKLWRLRGRGGQDISVDLRPAPHRLCPFYDQRWEQLGGYTTGMPATDDEGFGFRFYPTADGRWMMPLNPYRNLRRTAQGLLGVPDDAEAVRRAISGWRGHDLEQAGVEAGCVFPMLRSAEELLAEPHYRDHLATMPLIEISKIGDSAPEPLPAQVAQPLTGIRTLGMGHVIAGAGAGRALALHGADVLNIWRPGEEENPATYATANVGVRSTLLDPRTLDGAERIRVLLRGADVFYANRRPGFLDDVGLSAGEASALRPGIIHATASLNGATGPWARRIGFDQSAGCLAGIMNLEGDENGPALPVIKVVNDYITAWLLTTGIVEALARRAVDGGSYRVHVSLTRAALWLISLGVFEKSYATAIAGTGGAHAYLDPEVFTADTPMGRYQGVTDQVGMSQTPGYYRDILVPQGSSRAEWLSTP
ncbi:MAG: biosynthetic enzyme [Amycolatopsis sp.]|uniref:CoA transferase n=1 Tax=Amycolatopsis sp. TaxID=37632 RepID=UPI002628E513|nr:CoA transferase [Amycolatopsis sp.]MCU1680827.1 biosynthetic enzyme [Amycolatopsis sp.]